MTDSKEPRSDVLEAVERAIFNTAIGANHWESPWYADERAGCHYSARAALSAALDSMVKPSEGMRRVVAKNWGRRTWAEFEDVLAQYRKEALGDPLANLQRMGQEYDNDGVSDDG